VAERADLRHNPRSRMMFAISISHFARSTNAVARMKTRASTRSQVRVVTRRGSGNIADQESS